MPWAANMPVTMSAIATPRRVRRAVGRAGDAHQPALGLHDGVVSRLAVTRARLPEAGNRRVHQARVRGSERRVVEALRRSGARPEVLHEDVSLLEKPVQDLPSFGVLEIERDAFLVAVDAEEVRAFAAKERRAPATGVVPSARLLDLDDPGAHVAEQHRAIRPGKHPGEVENRETVERTRHLQTILSSLAMLAVAPDSRAFPPGIF